MAACKQNHPDYDEITYVKPEKITGHEMYTLVDNDNRKYKSIRFKTEISDIAPKHWDGWIWMEEFT